MFSSIANLVQQLLAAGLFCFAVGLAFIGVWHMLGEMGETVWRLIKQEAQKHSAHLHGALAAQSLYPRSRQRLLGSHVSGVPLHEHRLAHTFTG